MRTERSTDFAANALAKNVAPASSWLPTKIVSTAANAARLLSSTLPNMTIERILLSASL
jgi:hypothetical protein